MSDFRDSHIAVTKLVSVYERGGFTNDKCIEYNDIYETKVIQRRIIYFVMLGFLVCQFQKIMLVTPCLQHKELEIVGP